MLNVPGYIYKKHLKNTHPWVYGRFRGGDLHTIRRSDKYWAGIWADLTIEQVMMRAINVMSELIGTCLSSTYNMLKPNTENVVLTVVFDRYSDKNSRKAQEHHRRTTITSASLEINGNTKVTFNREAFLANTNNKDQLIKLLCARLKEAGFSVMQCEGDADISIVKTGIEYAKVGRNVAVVAEDTDVLVLLMHHWKEGMGQLMFGFEK